MSTPKSILALTVSCAALTFISACLAEGSIDGDPEPSSKGPSTGGKNPKVDSGVDPGDDPAPPPPDDPGSGDDAAPAPPPGVDSGARPPTDSGAPGVDSSPPTPPPTGDYPAGPYGYATGSTFPNVSFSGYRDGTGAWVPITMADYYDPTGARHVNGVFLDVSASWCGACRSEAGDLPAMATKYAPRGGKILTALIENDSSGPATQSTVDAWKSDYAPNFDIVADPKSDTLGPGGVGLPHNYVIDPRTMKILKIVEGSSGGTTLPGGFDSLLTKNGG